jgi:hypothetical protein
MDPTTAVEPIPLRDLRPWLMVAALLVALLYLVSFDQGAVSQGGMFLHELMHDGRHVFAVPCH